MFLHFYFEISWTPIITKLLEYWQKPIFQKENHYHLHSRLQRDRRCSCFMQESFFAKPPKPTHNHTPTHHHHHLSSPLLLRCFHFLPPPPPKPPTPNPSSSSPSPSLASAVRRPGVLSPRTPARAAPAPPHGKHRSFCFTQPSVRFPPTLSRVPTPEKRRPERNSRHAS